MRRAFDRQRVSHAARWIEEESEVTLRAVAGRQKDVHVMAAIRMHWDFLRGPTTAEIVDHYQRAALAQELTAEGIEPRRARRIAGARTLEEAEALADAALQKLAATGGEPLANRIEALWLEEKEKGTPHRKIAGAIAARTGYTVKQVRNARTAALNRARQARAN